MSIFSPIRPFVATVFFMLLMGACAHGRPANETLPVASVTYRSATGNFMLAYDLNRWRILRREERQVIMDQADVVFTDAAARHFMSVSTVQAERTLGELRTRALLALQQKGPDLKVLAQKPITVATVPGVRVSLRVTVRGLPLRYEIAFLQYGGRAYEVAYWSDAEKFDERAGDFDDLLQSFQLLRVAEARPVEPTWVAYPSPTRGYIVSLPAPGWKLSRESVVADADRQFETDSRLGYLAVIPEDFTGTLEQLSEGGVERLRRASGGALRVIASREVTVDGVRAVIVDAEVMASGHPFRYALLFAVKDGRAWQVAGWAPAELFKAEIGEQVREVFERLSFL